MTAQRGANSEVEGPPEPGVQQGRPGRRTAEDRTAVVGKLLSGKASGADDGAPRIRDTVVKLVVDGVRPTAVT